MRIESCTYGRENPVGNTTCWMPCTAYPNAVQWGKYANVFPAVHQAKSGFVRRRGYPYSGEAKPLYGDHAESSNPTERSSAYVYIGYPAEQPTRAWGRVNPTEHEGFDLYIGYPAEHRGELDDY